jgi:hypothetical protein
MLATITLETQRDIDCIKFTNYTLVRQRTPEKKILFVTMMRNQDNSSHIFQQYEIATTGLMAPGLEPGEIPLKLKDGSIGIITTTMRPSFSLYIGLFCTEETTKLPKPGGPQIFLSWERLKNGWPVSCRDYQLYATYGERFNKCGWSDEDAKPKNRSHQEQMYQADTKEKGFTQCVFERVVTSELMHFNAYKDKEKNADLSVILQVRRSHIDKLCGLMPTIDQVLDEHNGWKKLGCVSIQDLAMILDYRPGVPGFNRLFIV